MSDVIEISKVKQSGVKIVGMLAGQTGEGKTYSALQIALGLAGGKPDKVALLDTESHRGSIYSHIFGPTESDKFLIGDMPPPFSPERYITAMRQFAEHKIEALVIDSGSHVWEGEGGCEEIANNPNKKMPDWISAKRSHKRFVNAMLYLPFHVIVCLRAREKTSFKDPRNPVSLGILPICEKGFMFEATFSFLLREQGQKRDAFKLPECLRPILAGDGYLTSDHGKKLRDWVGGADPLERARTTLLLAASQGSEKLKSAWLSIDRPTQTALIDFKNTLKETAASADAENAPKDTGAPEQPELGEEKTW